MKEVVSKDHIYMYIEYRLSQDISTIVKLLKGKTSGRISGVKVALFGTSFFGYWFGCWSTSNIMDVMINEYLEHHRSSNNNKNNNFIIED